MPFAGESRLGGSDCFSKFVGALDSGPLAMTPEPLASVEGRTAQKYSFVSSGYVVGPKPVLGA